jgi:hypothetical protein
MTSNGHLYGNIWSGFTSFEEGARLLLDSKTSQATYADKVLMTFAPELFATLRDLVALARDPDVCDFDADSLLSDAESLIERVTK